MNILLKISKSINTFWIKMLIRKMIEIISYKIKYIYYKYTYDWWEYWKNIKWWNNIKIKWNSKLIFLWDNIKINDNVEIINSIEWIIKIWNWVLIWNYWIIRNHLTVTLKENVIIWPFCMIHTSNHNYNNIKIPIKEQWHSSKEIIINKNSWLSAYVIVLWWSNIWIHNVIWTNSVVLNKLDNYSLYIWSPVKKIKSLK